MGDQSRPFFALGFKAKRGGHDGDAKHAAAAGKRTPIDQYIADLAAQCGFTIEQAINHTLPQLKLLADAHRRLEARRARTQLAIITAPKAKDPTGAVRRLRRALDKQADD